MSRQIKFRAWSNGQKAMLEVGDNYGTTHDLDCCNYFKSGQDVELMQFTGLTDKNGKDIYEGDILLSGPKSSTYNREVKWKDGMFVLLPNRGVYYDYIMTGHIIGNIHENPELMEG